MSLSSLELRCTPLQNTSRESDVDSFLSIKTWLLFRAKATKTMKWQNMVDRLHWDEARICTTALNLLKWTLVGEHIPSSSGVLVARISFFDGF